jgi:predicted TIM-barrel fold metal-dependent hydrolase
MHTTQEVPPMSTTEIDINRNASNSDRLAGIKIIDTDTHVVEPPDLWTSRASAKHRDLVPHVRWDEASQDDAWYVNGERVSAVGTPGKVGWDEWPPNHPPTYEDTQPYTRNAVDRLAYMDEHGIHGQILYPNVALFNSGTIMGYDDQLLALECNRIYNDWLTDWASEAPDRLLPVMTLPFWDMDATLAEMERCAGLGHRGIVFSQDPAAFGLPPLASTHWDPMWASAQEKGLAVNFHVGTGDISSIRSRGFTSGAENVGKHASYAIMGIGFFVANGRTIAQLTAGGVCHRFPDLNFVSVESGIGWIPFVLEALDWHWVNTGAHVEHPEYDLMPSEYFKRQIYGCFWFERESALHAIDQIGVDNLLFETDFPHPTGMNPGPKTIAIEPTEYIRQTFSSLPDEDVRKILHDNAARIYHLD